MSNFELERLLDRYKAGDQEAFERILVILQPTFNYYKNKYFAVGEEPEDFETVCMTSTFESIRNYKPSTKTNITQYFSKCISYRLFDFITKANILKYKHLNESLPTEIYDESNELCEVDCIDERASLAFNTHDTTDILLGAIKPHLSDLEWRIMYLKIKFDFNYSEIADRVGHNAKKVDNIYSRTVKKLKTQEIKDCVEEYLVNHDYYDTDDGFPER